MSEDLTVEAAGVETSRDHAELVLETANDAFVSMDEHGTIIDWNRAAERILGWERQDALGRPLAETIIPERFRRAHYAGIERLLRTGEGPVLFQTLELSALHRSGDELPVEITIWPSRIAGRLRFNAFLRDVTERTRMRSHMELLQRVTATANAAEDLQEVVRAALEEVAELTGWPVGHAYVREDDDRLMPTGWWTAGSEPFAAFRVATERMGFDRGVGLPGRVVEDAEPALISELSQDPNFPRQRVAGEAGLVSAFAFPVMSQTRVCAVLEFYSPFPHQPEVSLLNLMANIGIQLGRVFERLRWQSELREALESKSNLLSLLAHEVRTPLTVIEGFADVLLEDFDTIEDEEKREYLGAIRQHASRLQRLTTNALHVSRRETGRQEAETRPVNLDDAIGQALAGLDLDDVEVEGDRGLTVQVDPDHLEQVLINYLANAVSYGQRPIWIEVAAEPAADAAGPRVTVRVCDRGDGVPEAFEPELFRSFRRGTTSGGGSGLGLWIVRQLVELNGGQAWYERLEPTGSAFALRLPQPPATG